MNAHSRCAPRLIILCVSLMLYAAHASLAQQTSNQTEAPTAAATQANDDLVTMHLTIRARNGYYIKGLKAGNVSVLDGKMPQPVVSLTQEDTPIDVGIIFDSSISQTNLNFIESAISRFIRNGNPSNRYFLLGFNEQAQLLSDWTQDTAAILRPLKSLSPKKRTALFDACFLGIDKASRGLNPKRVLLLFTDGMDNVSRHTFKDLRQLLRESDVLIYAIGIGQVWSPISSLPADGAAILDVLSDITGGFAFFPETEHDLYKAIDTISTELRCQYVLTFKPEGIKDKERWRKPRIEVKLQKGALPGVNQAYVRTREGYYASAPRP